MMEGLGGLSQRWRQVCPGDGSGKRPCVLYLERNSEIRGDARRDYFFLPSLTALRMIGMGTVDPT